MQLGEILFEAFGKECNAVFLGLIERLRQVIKKSYGFEAHKVECAYDAKLSPMEFNIVLNGEKIIHWDFADNEVDYTFYELRGLYSIILEHLFDNKKSFDCKNIALYNGQTGAVIGLSYEHGHDIAPCVIFCVQNKNIFELVEIAAKENAAIFFNDELCSKLLPLVEVGKAIPKDYDCYYEVAKIYSRLYKRHPLVRKKV